jgi:hypothetical protein
MNYSEEGYPFFGQKMSTLCSKHFICVAFSYYLKNPFSFPKVKFSDIKKESEKAMMSFMLFFAFLSEPF